MVSALVLDGPAKLSDEFSPNWLSSLVSEIALFELEPRKISKY